VIVLVPPLLSVIVVCDEERLPLATIAINNKITTMPPTTHTHGIVYHSLCSVVVVLTVVFVLSCAQHIKLNQLNAKVTIRHLKKFVVADKFFIVITFG
jgi:hypothetical protein